MSTPTPRLTVLRPAKGLRVLNPRARQPLPITGGTVNLDDVRDPHLGYWLRRIAAGDVSSTPLQKKFITEGGPQPIPPLP
jgi:hypothetical protein